MVTVACVYKPGKGFTDDYVWRLRQGVYKHAPGARFVCLTTSLSLKRELKDEAILIPDILPGWWNKMLLFQKGRFAGRVIYFDLDTIINKDISKLLDYDGILPLFLDDFNHSGNLATGVMSWDGDQLAHVYDTFMSDHKGIIHRHDHGSGSDRGDQAFMRRAVLNWCPVQDILPTVYSYKIHVRNHITARKVASVICFHGKPRPHEIGWEI